MNNEKNFFIENDGCKLNVTTHINDSASGVIVALHGGPGSGADPIIALPAFKKLSESFTMVYFDQRGSGKSSYDLTKGMTKEQVTSDVKAVVDYARNEFADKNIYLWGGSFGGLLGLMFLQRYPTAVDKAVISSPAINICGKKTQDFQAQYILNEFVKLLPNSLAQRTNGLIEGRPDCSELLNDNEFKAWIENNKEPIRYHEAVWHFYAMRNWLDSCDMRESIKDIKIKTLFLMGMEDPIISAQELIAAFAQYSNENIELKTFSPCGHAVFDDCVDEFCNVCTRFYNAD